MSEDLNKRIEQQEVKIDALKKENEKLRKLLGKDEVNDEYKDRLFKFIFGNPENKQWTLALYNAVNGTAYEDPEAIQFNTIGGFLYLNGTFDDMVEHARSTYLFCQNLCTQPIISVITRKLYIDTSKTCRYNSG